MTEPQAKSIARDMLEVGHFHFEGASWAFYEHVLDWRDRAGHYVRITYDRGQMEVFTGADVKRALEQALRTALAAFALDEGVPPALATDPTPANDVIYVISARSLGEGSPPRGGRVMELHVARSRILPGKGDWNGGVLEPAMLRFSGIVRPKADQNPDVASPGGAAFPGLDSSKLFGFVRSSQKDNPNQ